MESVLSGIPKVIVYLDDILVTGTSEEDHLHNLQIVLQKIEEAGLHLKKDKCKFMVPSITYLGHKVDAQGLHPLPDKIEAIVSAPRPKTVTELKAFLGLVNYYSKFIPNLASVLYPLYQLLNKGVDWSWSIEREKAFKHAKTLLTSNNVLIHYDSQKALVLACDASAYGVGVVLSHRLSDGSERPIGFASRVLSPAERNYSQIERESLACVFGVKKFHSYLYGRRFTLVTDHKPLLTLLHQHRAIPTTASNRIQRWALTLSMYEYSISFKPSIAHSNADALSRLPLYNVSREPPVPTETVLLLQQISESPISANQIRRWTCRDPLLSRVLHFVLSGWPEELEPSEASLKPFWSRKLELSAQDSILLWGNRVIVPSPGRNVILQELHACHPGIAQMKTLARMFVWWPCLDSDIEEFVNKCSICQSQRPAPPPAPIHPWKWPIKPWYRVHVDLAGPFLNHMFLIVIDAYSKWLEVRLLSSTTSTSLISSLRSIFAQFGIPSVIVSDNGRNFTSTEFEQFLTQNGIRHLLSSPYHPSSNGLAERGVRIFKEGMSKCTEGTLLDRISHVLFYNHITPQTTTGLSPAELLQNRRLQSRLDLLKPDLQARIEKQQYEQQYYSNIGSRYREFQSGEPVYVQNFGKGSKWIAGKIDVPYGNVSYDVTLDDGRTFRRHVDHIRKRLDTTPIVNFQDNPEIIHTTETPKAPALSVQPSVTRSETEEPPAPLVQPLDTQSPSLTESETTNTSETKPPSPMDNRYPSRHRKPPDRYIPLNFRRGKM